MEKTILRPQAEQRYQEELAALRLWDQGNRKPQNWQLSPKAVRLFILGSPQPVRCGGRELAIRKKYLGNDALVERCIITLAGNRGLMLVGEPGTSDVNMEQHFFSNFLNPCICKGFRVFTKIRLKKTSDLY